MQDQKRKMVSLREEKNILNADSGVSGLEPGAACVISCGGVRGRRPAAFTILRLCTLPLLEARLDCREEQPTTGGLKQGRACVVGCGTPHIP